ncbi:MAG: ComF family protein, partial [Clostridia bacterium]|nr:ComF family protein [Clostridia bacterium]
MKWYQKITDCILHCFFPVHCPYCDELMTPNLVACEQCQKEIQAVNIFNETDNIRCISPFYYDGIYKRAVLDLKFKNRSDYAKILSHSMAEALKQYFDFSEFDCITCIPPSKNSYRKRGYNQAELLAKGLSLYTEIPFERLLVKIKDTKVQHTISDAQKRKQNVKDAFAVIRQHSDKIQNKTILLVDDILTTGATLGECCKELYKNKAK